MLQKSSCSLCAYARIVQSVFRRPSGILYITPSLAILKPPSRTPTHSYALISLSLRLHHLPHQPNTPHRIQLIPLVNICKTYPHASQTTFAMITPRSTNSSARYAGRKLSSKQPPSMSYGEPGQASIELDAPVTQLGPTEQ